MGTLEGSIQLFMSSPTLLHSMTLELETGLPSTRLLQSYMRDKKTIEVKLVTGDTVTGTLSWQDPQCICLNVDGEPTVLWRSALVFLKGTSA